MGNLWGTAGGKMEDDENPIQCAEREFREETGYSGPIRLIPSYTYESDKLIYHNFLGVVNEEFPFHPKSFEFAQEHTRMEWMSWLEFCARLDANMQNFHPGIVEFFYHSQDEIKKLLRYSS